MINYKTLSTMRPLCIQGDSVFFGKGSKVYSSVDMGETFTLFSTLKEPSFRNSLSYSNLIARITRGGFHSLYPINDAGFIGIVNGAIVYKKETYSQFQVVHKIERGSRPLNICVLPSGKSFFGEYFSNPSREEVHIYGSDNAIDWSPVHTFVKGMVRHIHGLIYDKHRDCIWILTGDEGHEAGIWHTDVDFKSVTLVSGGTQKARAVSVIPYENGLIVPMDSPFEKNYINHLDIDTGVYTSLQELPGSAFYTQSTFGFSAVSTVVEPSDVNTEKYVVIYVSDDYENWKCLISVEEDVLSGRISNKYFQYPGIVLPPVFDANALYAWGSGVKDIGGKMVFWELAQLKDYLS